MTVEEGDESEDVSLSTVLVGWIGCKGERRSRSFTIFGSRKEDTLGTGGTRIDETTDSKLVLEADDAKYGYIYIPKNPK